MAHLDYAFLADYASVEAGKLTAVGASFTHLAVPHLPVPFGVSIAGRITAPEGVEIVSIGIKIQAPEKAYTIEGETEVRPGGDIQVYRGKIGLLFALTSVVTLVTSGLYVVNLTVDGDHARRLAFEVTQGEPA